MQLCITVITLWEHVSECRCYDRRLLSGNILPNTDIITSDYFTGISLRIQVSLQMITFRNATPNRSVRRDDYGMGTLLQIEALVRVLLQMITF